MGFLSTSCVLEGYEFQSPSNPSELPRHLDAPLQVRNTIYGHLLLFPTPLGHYNLRDQSPSTMEHETCVVMRVLNGSTTGWRRGRMQDISSLKNAQESRKSRLAAAGTLFPTSRSSWSEGANVEARSLSTLFPTPFGTATRASESPSTMKHDACAVAHVSDGLDEGRSRGGRDTTERWVSKIDASPWPACSCSTTTGCYPDPRPGGEDRREERGTRGFLG